MWRRRVMGRSNGKERGEEEEGRVEKGKFQGRTGSAILVGNQVILLRIVKGQESDPD